MARGKKKNNQGKGGGVKSQKKIYTKIAQYADEIIEFQINSMRNKKFPPSIRQSAANKLLDKIIPNLLSQHVQGDSTHTYKLMIDIPGVKMVRNDNNAKSMVVDAIPAKAGDGMESTDKS